MLSAGQRELRLLNSFMFRVFTVLSADDRIEIPIFKREIGSRSKVIKPLSHRGNGNIPCPHSSYLHARASRVYIVLTTTSQNMIRHSW